MSGFCDAGVVTVIALNVAAKDSYLGLPFPLIILLLGLPMASLLHSRRLRKKWLTDSAPLRLSTLREARRARSGGHHLLGSPGSSRRGGNNNNGASSSDQGWARDEVIPACNREGQARERTSPTASRPHPPRRGSSGLELDPTALHPPRGQQGSPRGQHQQGELPAARGGRGNTSSGGRSGGLGGGGSAGSPPVVSAAGASMQPVVHWPPPLDIPSWMEDEPDVPDSFR